MSIDTLGPQIDLDLEPFELLKELEQLALQHEPGTPEDIQAPGYWRGVAFRVGEIAAAVSINQINEVLTVPGVTHVPGSKPWLLGVANVRGNLLALVDLGGFLEGRRTPLGKRSRVLVARQGNALVGLLVDELYGQKSFIAAQMVDVERSADAPVNAFLGQTYRLEDRDYAEFLLADLLSTPRFVDAAA